MWEACQGMLSEHIVSPFLLSLMVDMYEEKGGQEDREEAAKVYNIISTGLFKSLAGM